MVFNIDGFDIYRFDIWRFGLPCHDGTAVQYGTSEEIGLPVTVYARVIGNVSAVPYPDIILFIGFKTLDGIVLVGIKLDGIRRHVISPLPCLTPLDFVLHIEPALLVGKGHIVRVIEKIRRIYIEPSFIGRLTIDTIVGYVGFIEEINNFPGILIINLKECGVVTGLYVPDIAEADGLSCDTCLIGEVFQLNPVYEQFTEYIIVRASGVLGRNTTRDGH
jgi:hypothetical protein